MVAAGAEVVTVLSEGATTPVFCVAIVLGRFNKVFDRFSVMVS